MGANRGKQSRRSAKGRLREKKEMAPVPRVAREIWYENRQADIDVPKGYRRKWSDEDTEKVIRAMPEEYGTYQKLAASFEPPRTPGAVRWRKAIAIHLLNREPYAVERAQSGLPKHHDWAQVHQVLRERGYYDLSVSEQMQYARHLGMPRPSWRGDGTQAVLRERKLSRLDTTAALRALAEKRLAETQSEQQSPSEGPEA